MKWVMIVLLGIVALIVIAVIGLLIAGQREGANRLKTTAEINASEQEVWQWLIEPEKQMAWISWLVDVEDKGPAAMKVGTRQRFVMEDRNRGNQRMFIDSEVTAFELHRSINYRVWSGDVFDGTGVYTLQSVRPGVTRLTTDQQYRYGVWYFRLLEPMITPQAQKKMDGDIATLKAKIEKK